MSDPRATIAGMHVVEATDWKDAAIWLLEPRSPYRPWQRGPEAADEGEAVLAVLPTDPVSMLTIVGRIGADSEPTFDTGFRPLKLVEVATFLMTADISSRQDPLRSWLLDDRIGEQIEEALDDVRFWDDPDMRFGRTSLAAANTLLHSGGRLRGLRQRR